ncbi:hypothetical protein EYR40_003694 [Pleurotus pulmonarius]|nr:hypothetical protein EYR36_007733 [Pleurotus pulmonarius]KAF4604911.1 hypothetical protein EYR40_003694 [Pleurotus pulmonarius]KAF4606407.1 hypothetical protein EYR38_000461 [Pleurotus pulmonarius]
MKESNSDLEELLCASLPSPILSASAMSVSLTSGTIPIFLDESDGPEPGDIPHGVGPDHSILSQLFLISIDRPKEGIPNEQASPRSQDLDQQEQCTVQDSSSQNSFGTFGPLAAQRTSSWCPIEEASELIAYMQNEHEDSADPNRSEDAETRLSEDALGSAVDLLQQDTPASFVHADDDTPFSGDSGDSDNAHKMVELRSPTHEEWSSMHSPPRSDRAGYVQSIHRQENDFRLYSTHHETTAQSKRTFKGRQAFSFPAKHPETREEVPSTPETQASGSMNTLHHQLYPDTLPWLKDIAVDLLIDQEGFRSVQPIFKLTGYSPQARSLHPEGQDCDGGVVEFMPVHRKTYNFHYAPFDSPPILRRVMVNKQESRDHISRQALLNIKDNGVYTVRGVETATFSVPYAKEGSGSLYAHVDCKMRWKFEYLVANRRLEKTGRFLDGEKTLTPLTFACSPLLLHPKQGKKVKLMHLVRKTVAAKLVAEKMELPARMRGPTVGTLPHGDWQAHRRTQSHAPQESHFSLNSESLSEGHHSELPRHVEAAANQRRAGRRRASSAGERPHNSSPLREGINAGKPSAHNASTGSNLVTGRHILPRSQLSEMIDSYSTCPPPPTTNGMTPLSPYRGNKF